MIKKLIVCTLLGICSLAFASEELDSLIEAGRITKQYRLNHSGDLEKRFNTLRDSVERYPEEVGRQLLDSSHRPTAERFVEKEVVVEGTLQAVVADYSDRASYHGILTTKTGEKYIVVTSDKAENIQRFNQKKVRVAGLGLANKVVSTTAQIQTLPSPTVYPQNKGDQKTLVVSLYFTDGAHGSSNAALYNVLFNGIGSVTDIYNQSSRGYVWFSGNVVGPFTIPYSINGACDYTGWDTAARNILTQQGINTANYQRITYALPRNVNCGWIGLAYVNGNTSWIAAHYSSVFAHELGHNLNMQHATTPTSEYGDQTDPMGAVPVANFNGPHQYFSNWLQSFSIRSATTGTTTLYTLDAAASLNDQVLWYPKTDTGEFYFVSYRTPQGISSIGLPAAYQYTVDVHVATPGSKTVLIAALANGQTFSDPTNGFTVTNKGGDGNAATVDIVAQVVVPPPPPADQIPPVVTWQYPTNNWSISLRRNNNYSITLRAGATDNVKVTKVEFYVNDVLIGTDFSSPYTRTWSITRSTSSGTYVLKAVAYDDAGNVGTKEINVNIIRN